MCKREFNTIEERERERERERTSLCTYLKLKTKKFETREYSKVLFFLRKY
jgi:hypothetical protein